MTSTLPLDRPGTHPVFGLAGSDDEARVAPGVEAALRHLPGVASRLAQMTAELRVLSVQAPFWFMAPDGLGDVIEQAQALREMAHALTAVVAGEVHRRGLPAATGLSRNDWVSGYAPGLEGAASAAVTAVGAAIEEPEWRELAASVRAGAVSVDKAAAIVRFAADVERVADPVQLRAVTDSLVENAETLGLKEVRRAIAHARASLRPPADVEDEAARLRLGRSLTRVGRCAGLIEYRLRLDPEGAAVLDAAIDPLARPRPDLDWTGLDPRPAHDPRLPATRRADALLELVGRAVAAPQGVTRTPRTQLVVTMSMAALVDGVRGAGVADDGEVLSASTVRRVACEAGVVPMVLGGPSQVLDLGRTERYFTPSQRLALGRRDGGCSYPGCSVPPQWCDAHHVQHWIDGGLTDVDNGALLCGRHHTVVHQLGLTARVLGDGVVWQPPREPG